MVLLRLYKARKSALAVSAAHLSGGTLCFGASSITPASRHELEQEASHAPRKRTLAPHREIPIIDGGKTCRPVDPAERGQALKSNDTGRGVLFGSHSPQPVHIRLHH